MAKPTRPSSTTPNISSFSALKVGTKLQEYEITGVLGEGGFGIVYLAHDKQLEREIAIKEYMPAALAARGAGDSVVVRSEQHRGTFEAGRQSFITEAKLLAKFKHPALVEIFRFWEQNGTAYMAMPFYRGQTLKQYVRENGAMIDERWLRAFLAPLLDALDQLHAINCYHRDISPDNILILEDGNPLLLDFGAARRIIGDLTQALTVILKPGYAPVEQYADDSSIKQGPWTDLYGIAAVCYFLITRSAPPAAVTRMMRDPMIPLATQAPVGYEHDILSGIDVALRVKPDDRPRSVREFQELLKLNTYRANTRPIAPPPSTPKTAKTGAARPTVTTPNSDDEPTQILPSTKRNDVKQAPLYSAAPVPTAAEIKPVPAAQTAPQGERRTPPATEKPAHTLPFFPAVTPAPTPAATAVPAAQIQQKKASQKPVILAASAIAAMAGVGLIAFFATRNSEPTAQNPVTIEVLRNAQPRTAPPSYPPLDIAKTPAPAPEKPVPPPAEPPAPVVLQEPIKAELALKPADIPSKALDPADSFMGPIPDKATLDRMAADKLAAEKLAATIGFVRLDIQPWGEVYINGVRRALSPPAKQIPLPAGDYQISIRNPGFPSAEQNISVSAKSTTVLSHQFR